MDAGVILPPAACQSQALLTEPHARCSACSCAELHKRYSSCTAVSVSFAHACCTNVLVVRCWQTQHVRLLAQTRIEVDVQDPEILALTKSEPLTLAEEYDMQQTWVEDPSKLCFILLDRTQGQPGAMAGDANLYWNDHEDPHKAEIEVQPIYSNVEGLACQSRTRWHHALLPQLTADSLWCYAVHVTLLCDAGCWSALHHTYVCAMFQVVCHDAAAAQVMIAAQASRRKGIASEALQLMMLHAVRAFSATGFTAKITSCNLPSRRLFEKLGYVHIKDVACFDESHYELSPTTAADAWAALIATTGMFVMPDHS